jgi:hypothetical protein
MPDSHRCRGDATIFDDGTCSCGHSSVSDAFRSSNHQRIERKSSAKQCPEPTRPQDVPRPVHGREGGTAAALPSGRTATAPITSLSGRRIGPLGRPGRRQSRRLPRYQHDNASRGLLRYYSPSLIEQSLWGLVVLFNIAKPLPGGIGQGPFDVNGLLATVCLPQGDNRLHAVGPDDNPARHRNTHACKLPLDGSGERRCAVARRTGDRGHRNFHVAGQVDAA